MSDIEGCFCEYASEASGGLRVMCQHCVDEMKRELSAITSTAEDYRLQACKPDKCEIKAERDALAKENEWHLASEPPAETEWVMVYNDGAMACRAWNKPAGRFEDWEGCSHAGLSLPNITHWKRLPKEPEVKL